MTEKHEILNREDIKNLFRTDIGHFDDIDFSINGK